MAQTTKLLFISQEMAPYLPETPKTAQSRLMPTALAEKGFEVRAFMPKYGAVNERRNQLHEVIRLSGLNIPIDDNDHPLIIKVATLLPSRMQVYFIDSEDFFNPTGADGLETIALAHENDERMMFYVRGVVETVKKLRWEPAIIQCDGWMSSLAPLYIKHLYADDPSFRNSKVVYTLRADEFEGTLAERFVDKLKQEKIKPEQLKKLGESPADHKALTMLALADADAVVVAEEGVNPEYIETAKALGLPVLEYTGADDFKQRLIQFHKDLLDNTANDK